MSLSRPPTVVPIGFFSDGETAQRPAMPPYSTSTQEIYLTKIADLWMKDRDEAEPGTKYILDRLPEGYEVVEKQRGNQSTVRADKYLFGHPTGKAFDSPNTFFPHFKFLMEHDSEDLEPCQCRLCSGAGKRVGHSSSGPQKASKNKDRRETKTRFEKGQPDFFETVIRETVRYGRFEAEVPDNARLDLSIPAEQNGEVIEAMLKQPSWMPRKGEIVLWYREPMALDCEIRLDPSDGLFKVFDRNDQVWVGFPDWEAGIVTQVSEEELTQEDLVSSRHRTTSVVSHGFRIEACPPSNGSQPGWSSQWKYVPLHHIRPFVYWGEYMSGVEMSVGYDKSMWHALLSMTSVAPVSKTDFWAEWPRVVVTLQGVWLGPELLLGGDAVRCMPTHDPQDETRAPQVNIVVLEDIEFDLSDLDQEAEFDVDVRVSGQEYTVDPATAWDKTPISDEECIATMPQAMWTYTWYRTHEPGQQKGFAIEQILGRLYEAEANGMWLTDPEDVNQGWRGVAWARLYGKSEDERRYPDKLWHASWYMGEDRAEQLGLDWNSVVGANLPVEKNIGEPFLTRLLETAQKAILMMGNPPAVVPALSEAVVPNIDGVATANQKGKQKADEEPTEEGLANQKGKQKADEEPIEEVRVLPAELHQQHEAMMQTIRQDLTAAEPGSFRRKLFDRYPWLAGVKPRPGYLGHLPQRRMTKEELAVIVRQKLPGPNLIDIMLAEQAKAAEQAKEAAQQEADKDEDEDDEHETVDEDEGEDEDESGDEDEDEEENENEDEDEDADDDDDDDVIEVDPKDFPQRDGNGPSKRRRVD